MGKQVTNTEIVQNIADNYVQLERSIVSQLRLSCDNHYVTIGSFREEIWQSLFEKIVPRKFSIERSVFIIDSQGNVSKEVDLAIFDEQYTPYIFNHGSIKYIPIEAVAVVVQCKSNHLNGNNIDEWVERIMDLKTSQQSIVRMYGEVIYGTDEIVKKLTQTSTRPIRILCHTSEKNIDNSINDNFDIVISVEGDRLKTVIPKERDLSQWYEELNHADPEYSKKIIEADHIKEITLDEYKINKYTKSSDECKEVSLMSLVFQLNQLLMLINNPILFPHLAYVGMINRILNPEQSGDSSC